MNNTTWGLIFIIIGLVLLLFMYGVISVDIFKDWWRLWPLSIVVIGLAMIMFREEEKKIEGVEK